MELNEKLWEAFLPCIEGLYIIEEKTKVICYANAFINPLQESIVGRYCYQAMAGREEPCDFCPCLHEAAWQQGEVYVWDFYDRRSKQWYKIKNRLVDIDGCLYRLGNVNLVGDMMELGRDAIREMAAMQHLACDRDKIGKILEFESSHDKLTGVYNRNQYIADLEGAFQDVECAGILFFDLNNLKEVNDSYFHSEGDRLLCRLAEAIFTSAGRDRRCYRIGGDEFILIAPNCTKEELERCRKRILNTLKELDKGELIPCSVAVGSAWSPSGRDLGSLVTEADRRMYENKKVMKGVK